MGVFKIYYYYYYYSSFIIICGETSDLTGTALETLQYISSSRSVAKMWIAAESRRNVFEDRH